MTVSLGYNTHIHIADEHPCHHAASQSRSGAAKPAAREGRLLKSYQKNLTNCSDLKDEVSQIGTRNLMIRVQP